jgi:hypothetical protein
MSFIDQLKQMFGSVQNQGFGDVSIIKDLISKKREQVGLPQPIEPGNIDLNNRPVVQNPDGTISTVRSISVNIDGKEVLIPTVSPDGRILSNEEAIDLYMRTGQHLGKFNTVDEANSYAQLIHNSQAQMYGQGGSGGSSW